MIPSYAGSGLFLYKVHTIKLVLSKANTYVSTYTVLRLSLEMPSKFLSLEFSYICKFLEEFIYVELFNALHIFLILILYSFYFLFTFLCRVNFVLSFVLFSTFYGIFYIFLFSITDLYNYFSSDFSCFNFNLSFSILIMFG